MDHRSAALFRVTLGIVCIGDLLLKYGDVEIFYTDYGIISRKTMLESFAAWYDFSFHTWNGSLMFQRFLFAIHALVAICFTIGFKTRLMTVLLYLFTRSIQDRLLIVLHSGDDVHRILLFWSMFLPLNACYSVDSAIKNHLTDSTSTEEKKKQHKISTFSSATTALLFQIGILYFVSIFHKNGPDWKSNYLATFYAANMDYYRTFIADILLAMPLFVSKALTFSVWWFEALGPFCLVFPVVKMPYLRMIGVVGFIMLHVGLGACMRLGQFIYIMIVVELSFIPHQIWDFILAYLRTKERTMLRIFYNQPQKHLSFSRIFAVLFKTFFLMPETMISDINISSLNEIDDIESSKRVADTAAWLIVENASGAKFKNADALVVLYRASPLLWPFASIVNLAIVKTIINQICGHLQRLTTVDAGVSPLGIYIPPIVKTNIPKTRAAMIRKKIVKIGMNVVVGILLLEVLYWNGTTIHSFPHSQTVAEHLHIVGLEQNWRMFSPGPPHHHFWHVIPAQLADGTEVELFKDGALWNWTPNQKFTWDPPVDQYKTYNSHPWYKFWENFNWNEESETLRLNFGRWICREYNKIHKGTPKELKTFQIWIVWESVNLDGTRTRGDKENLWSHIC